MLQAFTSTLFIAIISTKELNATWYVHHHGPYHEAFLCTSNSPL